MLTLAARVLPALLAAGFAAHAQAATPSKAATDGDWTMPAHDYASTRYSPLAQVTTANVARLKVEFTFSTGVNRGQEAAPIVVGDTMYIVTPFPNILYALDLTKPGAPARWKYAPQPEAAAQGVACCDVVNRGAREGRRMSSPCRSEVAIAIGCALALAGCNREHREYDTAPVQAPPPHPRLVTLQPGAPQPVAADPVGQHYEGNAWHVSQGDKWFKWFNCNGCHGNGGGAIGPALMDAQWRYGGSIDQIHASILEGRPNGMPAWRGKVTDQQAWQLSAYIRALSGNVRKDVARSRNEGMASTPPLTRMPAQPPRNGDPSAQTVPAQ